MLLASLDVLGPVAGPGLLVVQQTADAELLGRGAVPAGPVPRAAGLVAEDPVEPVAVLRRDRRVGLGLAVAVIGAPRVIAALGHASVLAREDKAVRTVVELGPAVDALPVAIAVLRVADHPRLRLAGVLLLQLLRQRACRHGEAVFLVD